MPIMLIADDNHQIVSVLAEYAMKEGFTTVKAFDGRAALEAALSMSLDIILLDVMMPAMDGFKVCQEIRKASMVPIIMVTARGEDFERIMCLDTGADDYVVKPFSPGEVMARVRAVMRRITRQNGNSDQVLAVNGLVVNMSEYLTEIRGVRIPLTKKETELLWTLGSSRNRVFSRENLLDSLWGLDYCGDSRTVDSHIKRLRAKLEEAPHDGWEIKTIWNVGYKFEVTA